MNAIGASILTFLIIVVFFASQRWALLGMMAGVLFLTIGQVVDVFGLNIYAVRFLELAGFTRVMVRKEFSFANLNGIDRALILVYLFATLVFLLRTNLNQEPSIGIGQVSTMDKIGTMVDATLCYFTFRGLIGSIGDFVWFLRRFVILLGPYVTLILIERLTGNNPFSVIGGTPEISLHAFRIRCLGSFKHPALLGTLGASFLPLYIGLVFTNNNRVFGFVGIVLCLAIVFLSNAGGPLNVVAVGMVGWLLWTLRTKMSVVRWAIIGLLALVSVGMWGPPWWLLDKVSGLSGGDGWHRSYLLDQAFANTDEWWFMGMSLAQTREWFPYLVRGAADITNLYLAFAFDAGILALAFFIILLVRAFQGLGQALAIARSTSQKQSATEFLLWGLGVMLSGHIVNFFAITYFDQIYVVWFMQLAAISTISQELTLPKVEVAKRRSRVGSVQKQSI